MLCGCHCGEAKGFLQFSKAWVPTGSPGCSEQHALICPLDLAGSEWEVPVLQAGEKKGVEKAEGLPAVNLLLLLLISPLYERYVPVTKHL